MPLSWDLILRFTLGGGQRRFTRFVALASLLGMMLGVAALITVLSVMNGFGGELHQRLLTVTPDMVLEPANPSEAALRELLKAATEQSAVVAATPSIRARRSCATRGKVEVFRWWARLSRGYAM